MNGRVESSKAYLSLTDRAFADALLERVAKDHNTTTDQLRGPTKTVAMVRARQVIIKALHHEGWTDKEIGQFISRDRSTVAYQLKNGR